MATNNAINKVIPFTVPNGGTGNATLAANSLLIGAGSSAFATTGSAVTGQMLTIVGGVPTLATSANGNFTMLKSTAGVNELVSVTHTDNTDANSHALVTVSTGGSSGGVPYTKFTTTVTDWYTGIDNTVTSPAADPLVFTTGGIPSSGTLVQSFIKTGPVSRPLQPAFLAFKATTTTNQTGAGTTATVGTYTEAYDQNSDFATPTFTAPVNGRYLLCATVLIGDLSVLMTTGFISIVTTAKTYKCCTINPGVIGASSAVTYQAKVLANMTAGNTATVAITISNGAGDTADVMTGDATTGRVTNFCGTLIA